MPTTYIQQLLTFVDVCIGLAGWLVLLNYLKSICKYHYISLPEYIKYLSMHLLKTHFLQNHKTIIRLKKINSISQYYLISSP